MRVLLTGAAGFAGHHMLRWWATHTDWQVTALSSFRHRGSTARLLAVDSPSLRVIWHDLRAPITPDIARQIGRVDVIINAAAESHVQRSIENPVPFVENNISVSLNILEFARQCDSLDLFVQVSTDEVYGPMYDDVLHPEWDKIVPSNPYSASKAAQEALALAWSRCYGIPLIITNTMNLYGSRQHPEKFVPMVVAYINTKRSVAIHSDSNGNIGTRCWLHAANHADALRYLVERTPAYRRVNVVGERLSNLEIAQHLAGLLDRPLLYHLEDYHKSNPGHDLHYGLDGSLLASLGWKPPITFEDGLREVLCEV